MYLLARASRSSQNSVRMSLAWLRGHDCAGSEQVSCGSSHLNTLNPHVAVKFRQNLRVFPNLRQKQRFGSSCAFGVPTLWTHSRGILIKLNSSWWTLRTSRRSTRHQLSLTTGRIPMISCQPTAKRSVFLLRPCSCLPPTNTPTTRSSTNLQRPKHGRGCQGRMTRSWPYI